MGGEGRFTGKEKTTYKTTNPQNQEESMNWFEGE